MMKADFEALYMDIYVGDERAVVERRRHLLRLWEKYKEEEDRRRAEAKLKRTFGTELQAWEYEKETDLDRTEAIRTESFDLQADGGKQLICQPPGSLLRSVSEFVFSKKTLEYVIDPIIADMQAEYFEALAAKRPYKAAWVRLRGYWSFAKAVGLYSLLKAVVEMWRRVS